ncbi:MAG: amino acid transporter, partial [Deltaproteobacteria bacterium]
MTAKWRPSDAVPARTIGLWGATGVGVGAIVGGGVMVLAGVAYASAGPAAIVAFAVNGLIAFITAMSYAEIATAFPESGGTYTFAKKVLSVRAAFGVGWILWFAYLVAAVLYALGFATYAALGLQELVRSLGAEPPAWLGQRGFVLSLAVGATALYALSLVRKATGGGQLATIGKVLVFTVIIVVGLFTLWGAPVADTKQALTPFFDGGASGLIAAAGFTFVAAQGFDLIPAIAGEIRDPRRNIPRAMFLSIAIAMAVYLPLLFVIATAGVSPTEGIRAAAAAHGDTVFAEAVKRFMNVIGY